MTPTVTLEWLRDAREPADVLRATWADGELVLRRSDAAPDEALLTWPEGERRRAARRGCS